MRKGQDKPIDVTIVRDVIRVKSVRSHTEGEDVGYIRITQFNEQRLHDKGSGAFVITLYSCFLKRSFRQSCAELHFPQSDGVR